MNIKQEKGFSAVDIAISVVLLTIFIALIGNLIVNINLDSARAERKNIASGYAVQEIERLKSKGYVEDYNDKGINQIDTLEENDIMDSDGNFTGYHKKVTIEDYVHVVNNSDAEGNLVKQITVDISYKVGSKQESVTISTLIRRSDS